MHLMIYTAYLLPMEHRSPSPAACGEAPAAAAEPTPERNGVDRRRRLLGAVFTRMRPGPRVADGREAGAEEMGVPALPGVR
jgi:hypothetical protein